MSASINTAKALQLKLVEERMQNINDFPALIIELTTACQVRCVWCMHQTFNKIKKEHMPLEKFRALLERNLPYLLQNNTRITPYSRGEPLMHPHFWECCSLILKSGLQLWHISTNLSLKIRVRDFIENPIHHLVVNLGGTTKEVHESCMVHSDFDLVTSNLRELWAAGVPAKVKINPSRQNIDQLDKLPSLVESLGGNPDYALGYTTLFPHPDQLSEEEKKFFIDNVYSPEHPSLFRFSIGQDGEVSQEKNFCPSEHVTDIIFANGQYCMCCHDQYEESTIANAFEQSIESIRESEAYRRTFFLGMRRKLPNCRYCS